jgi:hypothetical protein
MAFSFCRRSCIWLELGVVVSLCVWQVIYRSLLNFSSTTDNVRKKKDKRMKTMFNLFVCIVTFCPPKKSKKIKQKKTVYVCVFK